MLNEDNRVSVTFYAISFIFSLSLFFLVFFTVLRWPKLSTISHYRLVSLIIIHIFFIIMIYRLKQIGDMTINKLIEWVLCVNGGIFIITNIVQCIIYLKNPKFVESILFFQYALDPMERIILGFWNYTFLAMWIYNSSCFMTLLLIISVYKKYQSYYLEQIARALEEKVQKVEFQTHKYESQIHCCICLVDYEEYETISLIPCGHIFHGQCLDGWIKDNVTCPLCRSSII